MDYCDDPAHRSAKSLLFAAILNHKNIRKKHNEAVAFLNQLPCSVNDQEATKVIDWLLHDYRRELDIAEFAISRAIIEYQDQHPGEVLGGYDRVNQVADSVETAINKAEGRAAC
jgi:hypothetical protein